MLVRRKLKVDICPARVTARRAWIAGRAMPHRARALAESASRCAWAWAGRVPHCAWACDDPHRASAVLQRAVSIDLEVRVRPNRLLRCGAGPPASHGSQCWHPHRAAWRTSISFRPRGSKPPSNPLLSSPPALDSPPPPPHTHPTRSRHNGWLLPPSRPRLGGRFGRPNVRMLHQGDRPPGPAVRRRVVPGNRRVLQRRCPLQQGV